MNTVPPAVRTATQLGRQLQTGKIASVKAGRAMRGGGNWLIPFHTGAALGHNIRRGSTADTAWNMITAYKSDVQASRFSLKQVNDGLVRLTAELASLLHNTTSTDPLPAP